VVTDEYRDGNVGAGMATLPLIQRVFASLPPTVTTFAFRADTACYDAQTLQWLAHPARPGGPQGPIGFTIGADMTQNLHAVCAAVAAPSWQLFASGTDTKYLALVSNRWEVPPAALLRWHWQKAGTIELVHAITKNELGAAVPPCGRFGANAAWYRLSLFTYNLLSALKSLALPPALSTARPKRLCFALFTVAGRLVTHAGQLVLRVGAAAECLAGVIAARRQLALLAQALPAGKPRSPRFTPRWPARHSRDCLRRWRRRPSRTWAAQVRCPPAASGTPGHPAGTAPTATDAGGPPPSSVPARPGRPVVYGKNLAAGLGLQPPLCQQEASVLD
jgi:DDE family transposase